MTRLQKGLKKICLLMVKYAISNKKIPSSAIFIAELCHSERAPFNVILQKIEIGKQDEDTVVFHCTKFQ